MPRSIVVVGAGPGLGRAVAHRWAREGHEVVLVGRRPAPLRALADELTETETETETETGAHARAHPVVADLADTAAVPALAAEIRAAVGDPDDLYYAPTPAGDFVAARQLTAAHAASFMALAVYSLIALVGELLPAMVQRGDGAILTAQGASAVHGPADLSGPGPAQAAQRNYLQSLHSELAGAGVHVGALYVGAVIEGSAFHTSGAGGGWGPTVDPATLAQRLWTMRRDRTPAEASHPERE